MQSAIRWLNARAENVAAAMLAAMFATFVLQIFARYVLSEPFGWTLELCLTLWVWIVFWGCAFVVRERDHVTFDLFYLMMPNKVQRILALVSAAAIIIGFGAALYPTWDYINFLKIKKSATLHIPLRTVFSVYALFMIAVIISYAFRFYRLWRHGVAEPAAPHHLEVTGE